MGSTHKAAAHLLRDFESSTNSKVPNKGKRMHVSMGENKQNKNSTHIFLFEVIANIQDL